jgi:hypothetical protein
MPSRTPARTNREGAEEPVDVPVAGVPVLRLTPQSHRVAVGLVVPPNGRVVDISVQPSAACRALADAQRRSRSSPSEVDAVVRAALHRSARRASSWTPPEDLCWSHLFGGVAFPLLGAAYELDAAPVLEVPRWAAPALASRTVGDAAAAAFASAATRPVRRALVGAIAPMPHGEVDLSVLALALMGAPSLQPDRLARVLAAERVHQPSSDLPDPATLRVARGVVRAWSRAGWGEARLERVLVEAAGRPDGVRLLLRCTTYARQLGDHGPPQPLPNRLQELHDVHRALVRSAPEPAPLTDGSRPLARQARARRAAPAPTPAAQRPRHQPMAPPATLGRVAASAAITVAPSVRGLDGHRAGDLLLVLPHTAGDLIRWGRILSNCLGDFAPAAVAGRTLIVGVHRANRLVHAVELTPDGRIRQFCGLANRAPRDGERRDVVRALALHGVLDPRSRHNRPWLAGVDLPASITRAS